MRAFSPSTKWSVATLSTYTVMSSNKHYQILICDGPSCGLCHDSAALKDAMLAQIKANPALATRVTVSDYACFGRCSDGPNMLVREVSPGASLKKEPDPTELSGVRGFYCDLDAKRCEKIVHEHCGSDQAVAVWVEEY